MTDLDVWSKHHISAFTALKSLFSNCGAVDSSKSMRINGLHRVSLAPTLSSIFSDRFQSGIHFDLISFWVWHGSSVRASLTSQMRRQAPNQTQCGGIYRQLHQILSAFLFDDTVHTGNLLIFFIAGIETAFQWRGKDLYDHCAAFSPALVQRTRLCSPHHLLPLCQISEGQEPAFSRWIS